MVRACEIALSWSHRCGWGLATLVIWVAGLQIMLDKGQELDWFGSQFIVIWVGGTPGRHGGAGPGISIYDRDGPRPDSTHFPDQTAAQGRILPAEWAANGLVPENVYVGWHRGRRPSPR